jgi:hypothetical protein
MLYYFVFHIKNKTKSNSELNYNKKSILLLKIRYINKRRIKYSKLFLNNILEEIANAALNLCGMDILV